MNDRIETAKRLKLYLNCLRNDHFIKSCRSGSCRECTGRHNTLLHRAIRESSPLGNDSSQLPPEVVEKAAVSHSSIGRCVLLSTAIVTSDDTRGAPQRLRALLDGAREANIITASGSSSWYAERYTSGIIGRA